MFFFFNDTATTEIYTLSLHDALPISIPYREMEESVELSHIAHEESEELLTLNMGPHHPATHGVLRLLDRKSTRLNSSHANISYAVFCLKKTKTQCHF